MSAYAAPVDVKQAAMIAADVSPIEAETDPGWRTTKANARYEPIVESVLARHAWHCATAEVQLTFQAERTFGRYRYAYDEPVTNPKKLINRGVFLADPTSTWSDYLRSRPVDHTIMNGTILTNCKPSAEGEEGRGLVLVYGFRATEGDWSPLLAEAIVDKVKVLFAKKDHALALTWEREAERKIMEAAATEAQQASNPRHNFDDQIIAAWEVGRRRR